MEDSPQEYTEMAIGFATTYGLNILGAILILIIGWMFAGWAKRFVAKMLGKSTKIDVTLTSFLSSAIRYIILIFTIIAVLGKFGVQTTSLITILGAASLAIGLALQGTAQQCGCRCHAPDLSPL